MPATNKFHTRLMICLKTIRVSFQEKLLSSLTYQKNVWITFLKLFNIESLSKIVFLRAANRYESFKG